MIGSYGKVYSLGHKENTDLFLGTVEVQEKIDGSSLSAGKIDGKLYFHTRTQQIPETTGGQFGATIKHFLSVLDKLQEGYIYRGEAVSSLRHNVLTYGRVPRGNFVLFDVVGTDGVFLSYELLCEEADKIGVDPVTRFFRDHLTAKKFEEKVEGWFVEQSMLGGKIEGVVIKRYLDVGQMRGKWVRPEFKEKLNKPLKDKQDFLDNLVERYATEARFEKIVQHGKEQGELIGEMKDLSYLCKDLVKDVFEEEGEEIERLILEHYTKIFRSRLVKQIPQWYKEKLFNQDHNAS